MPTLATEPMKPTPFGLDPDDASVRDPVPSEAAPSTAQHAESPTSASDEPAQARQRLSNLPRLLRGMGGAVLVAAGFTFMLQSWERGDDVLRYYHFLGFTGLLAAAGFFCGLRIREDKGARTFLGLAAAAVPVHFTVLGALLYSQFPWLSGFADYPAYAHFSAPDQLAAAVTTAIGAAALVPICWTAFLAFARPEARRITAAYLLANAALLVPTRQPDVIGLLCLALLAGVVLFDRRVMRPVAALRTPEGRFVRALMAAPFAILIGRTFNLYEPSTFFAASIFTAGAVCLFGLVPEITRSRMAAVTSQTLSLAPTAAAVGCSAHAIGSGLGLHDAWVLPLVCLPLSLVIGAMSLRAIDGGARFRRMAALVATVGMAAQLVYFPGVASSIACLATAMGATAYGYAARQRGVLVMGSAALTFGLLYHLRYAADLYAFSPWGSLAALGMLTVLAASFLERDRATLLNRAMELKGRIGQWSS